MGGRCAVSAREPRPYVDLNHRINRAVYCSLLRGGTRGALLMDEESRLEPQMTTAVIPRLLTTKEAADLLNVSVSFLMKARLRGDGPRYRKVGRSVRYFEADVLEWLKARARTSTSEN